MFKATCDVCGKAVDKLHELKDLEKRLTTFEMKHICAKCGGALTVKMQEIGTKFTNQIVVEAQEWLLEKRTQSTKKILT